MLRTIQGDTASIFVVTADAVLDIIKTWTAPLASASRDNVLQGARNLLVGGYVLTVRTAAALTIETSAEAVTI